MRQVTDLAEIYGWSWVHFRPAQTSKGWRTPVSGPLGKGWVDLLMVRERDQRLVFAELKADNGKLSPEQERVSAVLQAVVGGPQPYPNGGYAGPPRAEVHVWHPADFDRIVTVLA